MKRGAVAVVGSERNRPSVRMLEARGFEVLTLPEPEIVPRAVSESELAVLRAPGRFDWVLFSDAISVGRLGSLSEEVGIELFEYDSPVICALGEAVADGLRFIQLHADIIPSDLTGGSVARSVADYAGGEGALAELSLLVIGSLEEAAPSGFPLASFGTVESVWLSELRPENDIGVARAKALLAGGAFEAVFVSSSYDIVALRLLATVYGLDILGCDVEFLCADDVTRAGLREIGLSASVV